jgi:DNA-binding beta-propeller fold protein YncE
VVGVLLAACVPPAPGSAGPARVAVLYVADEVDGTLTRLDGPGGRGIGPPLPAGAGPAQVAASPQGTVLVLARDSGAAPGYARAAGDPGLTFVAPAPAGGGWIARPVALEPGARAVLLASDGGDYAAVVYAPSDGGAGRPSPEAPCGLALIDLRTGAVEATYSVCAPRELPTGLALERTPEGPVAYLALWHRAAPADRAFQPAGGRLRRLAARTGAPLGEAPANGLPRPPAAGGSLLLAPGPAGPGDPALYEVEALPGSELATWGAAEYGWQYALSATWRLRRLTPDDLEPAAELRLDFAPSGLAVAPDGTRAYTFDARGDDLVEIDLAAGRTRVLDHVPGHRPWGLAATGDRVYVASPVRGEVWVVDRQRGRRVQAVRVAHAPVAISLAL